MSKQNIRLIFIACGLLVLVYFAAGYSIEIGKTFASLSDQKIDVSQVDNIMIDGSDFSPFMKLLGLGTNGLLSGVGMVVAVCETVVSVIVSAVLAVILRFAVYRKQTAIEPEEYKKANYLFCGAMIVSLLIGLIGSGGHGLLFILLLHLLPFGGFYAILLLHLHQLSKVRPAPAPMNFDGGMQ